MNDLLRPSWQDLRRYGAVTLRQDLQAGITVAVFAIPQAMAYAMLAGVPPVHGLYAAIVMSVVAALWGSSSLVNTGPTNSASLLTAAALIPFAGREDFLSILFLFTLMVGVIRLGMGLVRMGKLIDFVPDSAFLGFTVGAGLLIAMGQLHHLLGVAGSDATWFVRRIFEVLQRGAEFNPVTLSIGLGVLVVMLLLDRFNRRFPVALFAIVLATVAAYSLKGEVTLPLVGDTTPIPEGLPLLVLPHFSLEVLNSLWPGALAVAVIGLIEAVSIGQTLALKRGHKLDYDREFVGQGLSHIVGSFLQGLPGSGSFSRSTLIEETGGQTRMANVIFGLATALALLLVPGLLNLIPVCALAGLLLFIGFKLVTLHRIQRVFATSSSDAWVMSITFLTTVFIRIEYGIFVGILMAAIIYLKQTHILRLTELLPDHDHFEELPYDGVTEHPKSDLVVVGVSGDLFYGVSHRLRDRLNEIAFQQEPKHLVIRMRQAYSTDYSCWSALFDFASAFQQRGGKLYLCGVRPDYQRIIEKAGMTEVLPAEQVYPAEPQLFRALMSCTRELLEGLPEPVSISGPWQGYRDRM